MLNLTRAFLFLFATWNIQVEKFGYEEFSWMTHTCEFMIHEELVTNFKNVVNSDIVNKQMIQTFSKERPQNSDSWKN